MSNEEAIEIIKQDIPCEHDTDLIEALDMAVKAIEQTTWIPVSKRLPEEFESVLVCYKSQGGVAQTVSERLVNMDGSNRWSALGGIEPIAWIPLPKPYKFNNSERYLNYADQDTLMPAT